MSDYSAFIFDMNGTMIDDMHYHEDAWYHILVDELHATLSRDEVRHQLYGKNEELFERLFGAGRYTIDEINAIAGEKEAQYRREFLPHLKLIHGLDALLVRAAANRIRMAIGTAAIRPNVDFVLDNLHLRPYFPVIVDADNVKVSKPDPEVFLKAAEQLGIAPDRCIVFEDSPKGIEAARRAGMKAVGISSYHTARELASENVLCIIDDYSDPILDRLLW
jgi:beta-phosphoglucomutase family hydrolase